MHLKQQNLQMFDLKWNMRKFHPGEVVDPGRETQIRVDENLNY